MARICSLKKLGTFPKGVLVYGHFSSLHHGHIRFLRAAKEKGDKLFVALMGDDSETFSQKMQFNQKERSSILDHIELVDYIILLDSDEIDEAVKNNIRNLLQTEEGERFFQPNLGLGLKRLLFEHITDENLFSVQNAILDKFEFWLPFVEVRDIQVLTNSNNQSIGVNEIRVKILFNIKQDPTTLDSVTLSFNSSISEPESSVTSGIGGGY